ncbi:MAG: tetratricopeptide repeat protein [Nannocystaceae bacterium]|nr:tetratricopeptide repeat protein [Nannocystaceae bacterium]
MQQDERTLVTRLTALPEEPDTEAVLVAIRTSIASGGGQEKLPPDLFAGLQWRRTNSGVVVLHPTGARREAPLTAKRRQWRMLAAMALASATAAGVVLAAGALFIVRSEAPRAPTVVMQQADAPLPPPVQPPNEPGPPRDDLAVAEAVLVLGALHDEDPRTASRPKRGKKRWPARFRKARRAWRRGRVAYQTGDTTGARSAFDACLAIDAAHSHCLNSLGRLAADEHDPAAARVLFERAMSADASNPYPMVNLATLAILDRRLDDAEDLLRDAAMADPELEVTRRLGGRLAYLRTRLQPTSPPQ